MVAAHCLWIAAFPSAAAASHMISMAMPKPFFIANARSKPTRAGEAIDDAARHLAYKLYEATNRQAGAWQALGEIRERAENVPRALPPGSVNLRQNIAGSVPAHTPTQHSQRPRLTP